MKLKIFIASLLFALGLNVSAQQTQIEKSTDSPLLFHTFKKAKILQTFGRSIEVNEANIFLKNSTLVYRENKKVKQAFLTNILGVVFDDGTEYCTLDSIMGRLIAVDGYDKLLCVTTIDKDKYKAKNDNGENLPFFEFSDINLFIDIDNDRHTDEKKYPLKDTYFFIINNVPYQANERTIKKIVLPEKKAEFKALMKNKFWSWRDEASLKQLFKFIKKQP